MFRTKIPVIGFGLLILLLGCEKTVDYPDIPSVNFTEVTSMDSVDALGNRVKRVTVTFQLIDGNGDIGLDPTDNTGPFAEDSAYYFNLFLKTYTGENGTFSALPDSVGIKKYRIPNITPSGQNKTLIADISVSIEYPFSEADPLPFKEFRYEFYVIDRSLNFSNTDTTSVIVW